MKTSPYLDEIYAEGQASIVSRVREEFEANARTRLGGTIPDDILRRIEGEQDIARLMRWHLALASASSFDELRILFDR